jgi:hypothetical protein
MKRKFYLKNGEEVNIGDIIVSEYTEGNRKIHEEIEINDDSIPELLQDEIIQVSYEDNAPKKIIEDHLAYYIIKLAERKGLNSEEVACILDDVDKLNPSTSFTILLKEIAIEFDKKYLNHIRKCKSIFIVSSIDGKIYKVDNDIKNFNNFAAFRTRQEAERALEILEPVYKNLF